MSKEAISDVLVELAQNALLPSTNKITVDTSLFGDNSIFDSIGLVNYIVDVETRFQEMGIEVSLMSEEAMSRRRSPFRTIESLTMFIQEQMSSMA